MYFDPHYVQEGTSTRNKLYETYFCSKISSFPFESIDSSFSLAFYLKDLAALEEFYTFMYGLQNEYIDDFFLVFEDREPDYSFLDMCSSTNIISQRNIQAKKAKITQKEGQQEA